MTLGLTIQSLSSRYQQRLVLDGVDVGPVPAGAVVGVIGPNGAGKSTVLRAIAGLKTATGRVLLGGADLLTLPTQHRMKHVAYLPQNLPQPTGLSAYELVLSGLRAASPDMLHAQAAHRVQSTFDAMGVTPLAWEPMHALSGGQRQLIGLAQVLARQPRLLLLDEPTSALDLRWQWQVLTHVRKHAEQHGVIALLAIHDLPLAMRLCTHLMVLAAGRVQAWGPSDTCLSSELLASAWQVQGRIERCSRGHPIVVVDQPVVL